MPVKFNALHDTEMTFARKEIILKVGRFKYEGSLLKGFCYKIFLKKSRYKKNFVTQEDNINMKRLWHFEIS